MQTAAAHVILTCLCFKGTERSLYVDKKVICSLKGQNNISAAIDLLNYVGQNVIFYC